MDTSNFSQIQQQSVGIDVSSEDLKVRLGTRSTDHQLSYIRCRSFPNTQDGFANLLEWLQAHTELPDLWFITEATGVYYEELAYFLHQKGFQVCVLVARRAKNYAQSLPIKSKTDAIDARLLARYGLERQPRQWQLAEPIRRIGEVAGLGRETVLQVIAETNGFALVSNRNQLASYAGLDVALDQSGTRQGAAKISKQGNVHIRRAIGARLGGQPT